MLSNNPLRKQTLLGIAPKLPEAPPTAELTAVPAAETPLPLAENPLRKQTLMGVAPPSPAVTSDAPTTQEVSPSSDDSPPDESSRPASSTPIAAALDHTDHGPLKSRSRRPLWLAGAVALAAAGITLVSGQRADHPPAITSKAATEPTFPVADVPKPSVDAAPKAEESAQPTAVEAPSAAAPAAVETAAAAEAASAIAPTDSGAQGAPAAAAAPVDAAPAASGAPAASASAAAADGPTKSIKVESDPPGARLFWHGKSVGTTPFVLEYHEGEKHAYEMGLPGYVTRKVVIDSSDTLISIGLRPDPAAPPGATRRKQ
ncbi:MAG TPA: hypothetical protein VEQ58_17790 [Polyangiaceae bacterium]|nr:hypothetical protein [Polyangiaceae bacterium]